MDLSGGVAVRLSALCLDATGRLSERLICSDAVRGGLLLDLALAGRVESAADSIVVDDRPTGFPPADRLLMAIAAEPERSLDGWLGERRIGLRDVVDGNVASGRWGRRPGLLGWGRRFIDRSPATTAADRHRSATQPAEGWSPADACVTALAVAAELIDRDLVLPDPPGQLVDAAGSAAWLTAAVVEHLEQTSARYAAQAATFGPF